MGLWLVGGFSLSVALHVLLIVCHLDNPGAWWWVGSTLLMLLFLLLWLPVTAENKGCFRLPLTGDECHFVVLYRCTNPEFDPRLPWLPYVFNIRRLPEPWMR